MSYYLLPHISNTLNGDTINVSYKDITNSHDLMKLKTSQCYLAKLKQEIEKFPYS